MLFVLAWKPNYSINQPYDGVFNQTDDMILLSLFMRVITGQTPSLPSQDHNSSFTIGCPHLFWSAEKRYFWRGRGQAWFLPHQFEFWRSLGVRDCDCLSGWISTQAHVFYSFDCSTTFFPDQKPGFRIMWLRFLVFRSLLSVIRVWSSFRSFIALL